jgi:glycosyltransferase involved in cell wall biosynthesis
MKLSIIVPTYNVEKYIFEFISGLQCQTNKNFEVIFVDDGSIDNSLSIIKSSIVGHDSWKYYSKENEGVGIARNFGLRHSTGDYVYFADPDDVISEDFVETVLLEINRDAYQMILFGHETIDENGTFVNQKVGDRELEILSNNEFSDNFMDIYEDYNLFSPWNKVYLKRFLNDYNLEYTSQKTGQDAIFNLCNYQYLEKIKVIPACLYRYRMNREGSAQTTYNPKKYKDNLQIAVKLCQLKEHWQLEKSFIDDFPTSCAFLQINELFSSSVSYQSWAYSYKCFVRELNDSHIYINLTRQMKSSLKARIKRIVLSERFSAVIWFILSVKRGLF